MRRTGWIAVVAVLAAVTLLTDDADARRLGGGRSFGAQRQSVAPPSSSLSRPGAAENPVMPANPSVAPRTNAAVPPAAAPAPARSGMSRWLGPIAGIAAGLGLAALLSHFGLSEGFASLLLIALLVIGVVFLARLMFMRRAGSATQYAGPNTSGGTLSGDKITRRDERVEPVFGGGTQRVNAPGMPPGFDKDAFLRQARVQFKALQAAWDAGDLSTLGDVTTPEMFEEIRRDLTTRGTHQPTEVVRLDADVLDVATEGRQYWVSVRFSGLIREDGADAPKLFDETWNLVKPVDGSSGWLLAGIQQNEAATTH